MVDSNFSTAVTKSKNTQSTSQANTAFEMLFSEAGRRQSYAPTVEYQSRSHSDNGASQERNHANVAKQDEQPTRRRQETPRAEESESSAGAAVVQSSYETNDEPIAINEDEIIAKVAEIMQVPVEVVMEWLQELELVAMDLTDTQAIAKMLQVALDAESAAELLTDAKFPELYNAINEAMAEVAIKAVKTADVQIKQEVLNVLAEDIEMEIEDGEIVVTNNNMNENSANSSRQQTNVPQAEMEVVEQTNELTVEQNEEVKIIAPEEVISNDAQAVNPAISTEVVVARAEQAVRQAVPQQPVNTTDVIDQIMNQVKIASGGGQFNEIRMTLRPETLGDIVLRVVTQNGIVMAQFEAENQRVKEALEADFNSLRNA
jgi:flagellar hook-length control protein FliK